LLLAKKTRHAWSFGRRHGSLLPKLGTILSDEYKLQKRVRGEIRFLKAEMESMQAALNRVSKLPAHQIMILTRSGRGT